jgi:hydrophobic/amphiphilic exporter-1 (mainly G- bacteria), HAE1 family
MRAVGKWSIENKVSVSLLMIFIILAGFSCVFHMKKEGFPQFGLDMITINVAYPGASPEEIEEGICIKIEDRIGNIEGISRITSTANENYASVLVEIERDSDSGKIKEHIKAEIDSIDTFPEDAKEAVIVELVNKYPVISVAIYGDILEKPLREIAERVKEELLDFPDISQVVLVGARNFEISVEVSEANLRKHALSFDDIVMAIKSESLNLPGGTIKTESGEILVKTKGQRYTAVEFEKLALISLKSGAVVYLGDVAQIRDGFEELDIKSRFNGKPAIMMRVYRTDSEDTLKISETVVKYVEKINKELPEGLKASTWLDMATMVKDRISLLVKNGIQGIILVFIILILFLNLRLAIWVAAGIPISFMVTFIVLDFTGGTINMLSLFAFIMTLGILVDDAIIIGENVYTHFSQRNLSPTESVLNGLEQVGIPVLIAVSTTIVAFIPMLFVPGIFGKFVFILPHTVIIILIASLFEAFIILPAHLHNALSAYTEKKSGNILFLHKKLREKTDKILYYVINRVYTPVLNYFVKNRYFALSITIGVFIISVAVIKGGYVPFVFYSKADSSWIIAKVIYPLGTPFEVTKGTIEYLEENVDKTNRFLKKQENYEKDIIINKFSLIGSIPNMGYDEGSIGSHCGEIWIEVLPSEERPDIPISTILNTWRKSTGEIPGVEKLTFTAMAGGPVSNPVEIQLIGDDLDILQKASEEVKKELKIYPGIFDVSDSFRPGKAEKRITIKGEAKSLGISMAQIAKQIRQAFYGEEVLTIQRGKHDLKVRVRYTEKERHSLSGIEDMRVRTQGGRAIPIEEVANLTFGRAYASIVRVNQKRVITVSADIDELVGNAEEVMADLKANFLPKLVKKYHGIKYDIEGEVKRTTESLDNLKKGAVFAFMVIFFLLALQFKSYFQPLIIMTAIPFGLIGVILGHLIMGISFTMLSMLGSVALSGIVINDSLILIDFINKARLKGIKLSDAVINAGIARFRPVILTSLTTIAGLFPLLLGKSFQAQFLIPMAVSITFGIFVATGITLVFVPLFYMIIQDIKDIT